MTLDGKGPSGPKRRLALVAFLVVLGAGFAADTSDEGSSFWPRQEVRAQDAEGDDVDPEYEDYELIVGDTIEVNVFEDASMSKTIQIPPGGKVTFNPIGLLTLVGKSPQDLEAEITDKLLKQDIIKDPKVQIHIVAYAPREVFFGGTISGKFNLPVYKPRRLLQVIAEAGGWGGGDRSEVKIIRKRPNGDQYTIKINAEAILENEDWSKNIIIKPEDYIIVPPYQSSSDRRWVYVLGRVGRPGPVPYMRGREPITLMRLIVVAGDFTEYADSSEVRIIRKTSTGRPRLIEVDFSEILDGERDDVVLEPDDLVFVPESWL